MSDLLGESRNLTPESVKEFIDQKVPTNFVKLFFKTPPEVDGVDLKDKGIAAMQEYIEKTIYSDPDITLPELMDIVRQFDQWTNLTEEEFKLAQRVLVNYVKKHQRVREVAETYNSPEIMFEFLFGKRPKGKIEVVEGPISLYFRCSDRKDFEYLYTLEFFDSDVDPKDVEGVSRVKGVFIDSRNPIFWTGPREGLEGALLAENTSVLKDPKSQQVIVHEEMHALYKLFSDVYHDFPGSVGTREDKTYLGMVKLSDDDETKEKYLRNYIYSYRRKIDEWIKEEYLAFLKEGCDPSYIYYWVSKGDEENGSYDYLSKRERAQIIRDIKKDIGDEYSGMIRKDVEIILNKGYQKGLVEAKEALERLLAMGFSRERVVFLLLHQPLSRWNRIAKRATF